MPAVPALPATNLPAMPALPPMVDILPQPCSDGVETDMEGVQSTKPMQWGQWEIILDYRREKAK